MRPLAVLIALALAAVASVALAQEPEPAPPATEPAPAAPAPPGPDEPLPRGPRRLAERYSDTTSALLAAIDAWDGRGATPRDVALLSLHRQRIVLRLVRARALHARVMKRLPRRERGWLRDDVLAKRELAAIHSVVVQRPKIRIGPTQPAARLLRHYRRAQARFDIGWPLLAAVNLVETAFGRMRNESTSGARGPMQFMPATWRAYGLGGNVKRPRDAILGAANYLSASGAPRDEARALYAYNPSRLYVKAVSRYAKRIRADRRAYLAYHAQAVFLRKRSGYRRVSAPGR